MATPALLLYGLGIVLAVLLAWGVRRRRGAASPWKEVALAVLAARRRGFVAVAFAVVVFLAVAGVGIAWSAALGWPLAVAPPISAAAGMLLYAATPPQAVPLAATDTRGALLERRTMLSVAPRRWLWATVEALAIAVVIVVFCGMTASADEAGRLREIRFEAPDASATAGPYPGWFYGVPVLIALGVLVVVTAVAAQRISATPAFPRPELADVDRRWRRDSVAVLLTLATGAMLCTGGGLALTAGAAIDRAVLDETSVLWSIIGDLLRIGGVLLLVLSIVSVTLAALTAFRIGEGVAERERVR